MTGARRVHFLLGGQFLRSRTGSANPITSVRLLLGGFLYVGHGPPGPVLFLLGGVLLRGGGATPPIGVASGGGTASSEMMLESQR